MPTTLTPSLPRTYTPHLGSLETEEAIAWLKSTFTDALSRRLHLQKVCEPVIVQHGTGVNDDLNGVEAPVHFTFPSDPPVRAEVVQSLAKWKRWRLHTLGVELGRGIYTDMRALRPDEAIGPLHSVYVDQWDWEKRIAREARTRRFLEETVRDIYEAIRETEGALAERYPALALSLPESVTFVHAEELYERYPKRTPTEREEAVVEEHGAVFVVGVGAELGDGRPHDGRAPDYDDWTTQAEDGRAGLNGDLILWHPVLERAVEVSSMGIRVDAVSLERQLYLRDCMERLELPFHRALHDGTLPLSIGGGIGQSRLCLCLLQKVHVGEVQVGLWPEEMRQVCREQGIPLMD